MAYISTINDRDNDYYVALENPSVSQEFSYSPAGDFNKISLIELEKLVVNHLRLDIINNVISNEVRNLFV